MYELKLMTWQDKDKLLNEVRIIEECVQHNLCSQLQSMFGLGAADITENVKQNPQYCCQVVFQKWHIRGSNPKDSYPISWNSIIKVLMKLGLNDAATRVRNALSQKM